MASHSLFCSGWFFHPGRVVCIFSFHSFVRTVVILLYYQMLFFISFNASIPMPHSTFTEFTYYHNSILRKQLSYLVFGSVLSSSSPLFLFVAPFSSSTCVCVLGCVNSNPKGNDIVFYFIGLTEMPPVWFVPTAPWTSFNVSSFRNSSFFPAAGSSFPFPQFIPILVRLTYLH